MKGVRCSWVDMMQIRQALSNGERGDAARLERIRCVDQTTVSAWQASIEVMQAIDGKYDLSHVSNFQPTHAREIARAFRRKGKNWSEAAKAEIVEWVERCEEEGLTVQQLRALLRDEANGNGVEDPGCTVGDLEKLVTPGKRFGTIYADPPWQYDNQATRAATDNHYGTMAVEEIAALPVRELAADPSHLHLWATDSFLEEAIGLLKGWGFKRRQTFIWCKPQLGIGNYWRSNHEYLLLGIRGDLTFPDESAIKSYLELPRSRHSSKPHEIRKLIERVSPGPRLELFGRQCVDGWTVWGNQIERGMFDQDIKEI